MMLASLRALAPGLAALALLLPGFVAPATALMPPAPELVERLEAEGTAERVYEVLRRAQEGYLAPTEEPGPEGLARAARPASWRALVILVDFADQPATGLYNEAEFDEMLFSTGVFPTGSMKDFYDENSYGNFQLQGDVVGWLRMPQPYSYYCNQDGVPGTSDDYGFGSYPNNAARLYEDAIAAADPLVDFGQYANGRTRVEGVFVVHSGPGAESTGNASDIWSHKSSRVVPTNDGISVGTYTMEPELLYGQMSTMGVFAHEFGHSLDLPDLYDTDYSSRGVGRWCLMAGGSWNDTGRTPAHYSAWCKKFLGWVTSTELTADEAGKLLPPADANAVHWRFRGGGHAAGEYFLLENRRRAGFDAALPGEGLLLWHVDGQISGNSNESCGPGASHPKVRLVQADGLCDLENDVDSGDGGDPFPGSSGATSVGTLGDPSTQAYSGQKSGLRLDNIAAVGNDISVDITTLELILARVPLEYPSPAEPLALLGEGDEVRILDGASFTGSFDLQGGVHVSGGWDGAYASRVPGGRSTLEGGNSQPVLSLVGAGETVVEGLTLRGGKGALVYLPGEEWRGGGIQGDGVDLVVRDVVFEDNVAGLNLDNRPSRGGAISLSGADLRVENSSFSGNLAREGGAVYVEGGRATVVDSDFLPGALYLPSTSQDQRGGAILVDGGSLHMVGGSVGGRSGATHGGAAYVVGDSARFDGVAFDGNAASARGGALDLQVASWELQDVDLLGNAVSGGSGGAVYLGGGAGSWQGGSAVGNSASLLGGALYAVAPLPGSALRSVVFDGNQVGATGAALMLSGGALLLEHLVVHGSSGGGSGLLVANGDATLRNSLLTGHQGSGTAVAWSGTPVQLDHNLYWDNANGELSGASMGASSIVADPLYADAAGGDFQPGPGSPALDRGDPSAPADFDGSAPDLGAHGGSADPGGRPGVLVGASAVPGGGDTQLAWSAPAVGTVPASLRVYRAASEGGPRALLATLPGGDTSHTDVGVTGMFYWVEPADADGHAGSPGPALEATATSATLPSRPALAGPVPNPFNPSTVLELALPAAGPVRAVVYDLAGRRVRVLHDGPLPAGRHALRWDGRADGGAPVASGSYRVVVRAGGGEFHRGLVLLK